MAIVCSSVKTDCLVQSIGGPQEEWPVLILVLMDILIQKERKTHFHFIIKDNYEEALHHLCSLPFFFFFLACFDVVV